ncbi:hypothetical protein SASPL_142611 [Salvia splendens]|uniref:ABC transporter domain-containing protein n=1 Tax=Salvia splendens TaxID=180675 RepID=A0A8X8Z982_SALSN|nr:hypothetical protein SASPL_142611 [Salvia splendens]
MVRGQLSARQLFLAFFILMSTGKTIADASATSSSDTAKSRSAVISVFAVLAREGKTHGAGAKVDKVEGSRRGGKSTVVALIERFYDPMKGMVLIDGRDVRTYDSREMRMQIALVSQEPALFAGTIRENIIYGRDGATETRVVVAHRLSRYRWPTALYSSRTGRSWKKEVTLI